jgi:Lipopolysaccharide-assembly
MVDGFGRTCQGMSALLTLGMLIGSLVGCGYTLVGAPSDAPGKRLPLNILPFTNQTHEPDLERLTTAALRHAIVQSQMFVFTADGTSATRLQGAVRRFSSYPLALDAQDNVVQYRIDAAIYIRLIEAATQRPLLEQELSSSAVYLVSRSTTDRVREDVAAREAALARLAQQFADKCLALLAITLL